VVARATNSSTDANADSDGRAAARDARHAHLDGGDLERVVPAAGVQHDAERAGLAQIVGELDAGRRELRGVVAARDGGERRARAEREEHLEALGAGGAGRGVRTQTGGLARKHHRVGGELTLANGAARRRRPRVRVGARRVAHHTGDARAVSHADKEVAGRDAALARREEARVHVHVHGVRGVGGERERIERQRQQRVVGRARLGALLHALLVEEHRARRLRRRSRRVTRALCGGVERVRFIQFVELVRLRATMTGARRDHSYSRNNSKPSPIGAQNEKKKKNHFFCFGGAATKGQYTMCKSLENCIDHHQQPLMAIK
jgi:hypothetical protein